MGGSLTGGVAPQGGVATSGGTAGTTAATGGSSTGGADVGVAGQAVGGGGAGGVAGSAGAEAAAGSPGSEGGAAGSAGAGGVGTGDPACPASQPDAGDCEPLADGNWLVCHYEGPTNCTCPPEGPNQGTWVCNSCPTFAPFTNTSCAGYHELECEYATSVCACEGYGATARWNCVRSV